jgi:hypothetical protein
MQLLQRCQVLTIRIVTTDKDKAHKRVIELVKLCQDGLCWYCKEKVSDSDPIVSRGNKKRHYYHVSCASRLNIIIE